MEVINAIIVICLWGCVIALMGWLINHWLIGRNQTRPFDTVIISPRPTRTDKLRKNGGKHTASEWAALCAQYRGRCLACKRKRLLTKDHVIPIIAGGTDDISNIQPLCRPCNSSKGTKTIDYRSTN